jgi:hypothetical protein
MFQVRKMQAVAIAAAAVFSFAASQTLSAQDTGTGKGHAVVYHVAGGTFEAPPLSGNDLLELQGNPFMISVIGNTADKPVKHGKGYAIYHNIEVRGAVTSTFNPTKPFQIHSKKGILLLSVGNPNYDELKYTFDYTITGIKLTITADVQAPKGTLQGFLVKPFTGSLTLTDSPSPNMTVTYKNSSATTVLGVSAGTLTGTIGKP